MQQVPIVVKGIDGKPVHHGVVERSYEKFQSTIHLYVLDK